MVEVIEGQHAGTKGTIKHIDRTTLFLHSRTHIQNGGIVPVRARSTLLAGKMNKGKVMVSVLLLLARPVSCKLSKIFVQHLQQRRMRLALWASPNPTASFLLWGVLHHP